ncbi:hypothetical protein ACN6KS_04415 [Paenibacillus nitricinens]|uniref:hypothetical protein n=1 Tax=Paenibacillus nitricinens TaxID=3367691 RepID=UPI003F8395FE
MIIEAEKVLLQYSFINPIIEFIRHNENITFKVTDKTDNKNYLYVYINQYLKGSQAYNIHEMDYRQKCFFCEKSIRRTY